MRSNTDYDLIISPDARQDIVDIQNYTFENFGQTQWEIYEQKINNAFETLLHNPFIGHLKDGIPPTFQAWGFGQHVIYYSVDEKECIILVCRILHARKDVTKINLQ